MPDRNFNEAHMERNDFRQALSDGVFRIFLPSFM
jgi:hypothetical protein